jgi:hypothetical protein
MRRFLLKIGLLLGIVVVADIVFGYSLEYVTSHIAVGGQGRDNYIANQANEDVLVFGSSRAVHHYNPEIIEHGLGMSCYNCGDDGSGIILSYGRLLMLQERHQPKVVIYDVNPSFDLEANDNHKYLGWLRSHYDRDVIKPIFNVVDKKEKYKMVSRLYRYNSRFLQNLVVFATGRANDGGIKGYRPIKGALDRMKIKEDDKKNVVAFDLDTLKLRLINDFIDSCEGTTLFFVVSPIWYGMDELKLQPIRDICEQRGIQFFDYSGSPKYVHQDKWFKDGVHLNSTGADEFTRDLMQQIQSCM